MDNDDMKRAYTLIEKPLEKYNYFTMKNLQNLYKYALENQEDVESDVEEEQFSERFDTSKIPNPECDDTNIYIQESLENAFSEPQIQKKESKEDLEKMHGLPNKSIDESIPKNTSSGQFIKCDCIEEDKNDENVNIKIERKAIKKKSINSNDFLMSEESKDSRDITITVNEEDNSEKLVSFELASPYFDESVAVNSYF
ncbi:hypothetical protein SteCoe_39762 [Stentor coeruleus]|uniref:Uncharacterized protein n=1 Tax=Stentor coeruleus TaxID=5963 RepID=A0A1R2AKH1_9CILI|nr:hypothetical protein SteCoe_39762 [Stentor coeruleus]